MLREYQKKRHFKKTPEPLPKVTKRSGWKFVVQKHAASHLHYDFRLELDGVLKSWAVPKGPSLDPRQRRLAMQVEDHPVKYAQFEGIIPPGEYGGGTVMLWDRGTWEPVGDPRLGYRNGKLKFRLRGKKLNGGWMLVRTSSSPSNGKKNAWLLIKEPDEQAKRNDEYDVTQAEQTSVATDRSLEEIATDTDHVWKSNGRVKTERAKPSKKNGRLARIKTSVLKVLRGARVGTLPEKNEIQLATAVKAAPEGDQWLHEIKFDGYRMVCRIDAGKAQLITRNQLNWTNRLSNLVQAAAELPVKQAILDGELVAMKPDGKTDFQTLQNAFSTNNVDQLLYFVFDLLYLDGFDSQSNLIYCGKVGTGFSENVLRDLRERMDSLACSSSPFKNLRGSTGIARHTQWVRPQLVAQIAFSNWTRGGHLRQPTFLGLREDKAANMVTKESIADDQSVRARLRRFEKAEHEPKPLHSNHIPKTVIASSANLRGVKLTNPQRILYPDIGITKLEMAQYYADVAKWILPHVENRPLSLVRCPDGLGQKCFFQKHPGIGTPATFRRIPIEEKNRTRTYLIVDDAEDLISLAQISALEVHVWGSQADKLESPDRMIFDLDPDPLLEWERVVESAHQIREFLAEGQLASFVKTTGGKGLHIVIPLQRRHSWDEVKAFSKAVAERIVLADPRRYVSNMSKTLRTGKIFIDYLRNDRSATAIAPYSTRAKAGAPISVPLTWEELTPAIHSNHFTIRNLRDRLESLKRDPWADIAKIRQSLTAKVRSKFGI